MEVVIQIDEDFSSKDVKDDLIHHIEKQIVVEWIEDQLRKSSTKPSIRLHETITISGTRGSGKSTFLSSVRQTMCKHTGLCVLPVIDPTLTEEKGHIFLDIISRIKREVDKKLDRKDLDPTSGLFLDRKKWHEDVTRLAHGLPQLDGVGGKLTENSWHDAEYIMHNGLNAVESARDLERNFHKLVENALIILEKKAFLIIFDDVDIDFSKGWRVIETIRKYFTTPQIISIISGDLRLYAKAIRKQQWKNFGKALLINEGENRRKLNEFNDLVSEMETQYMQKVLPLSRRITLTTLNEKLRQGDRNSRFVVETNGKQIDVSQYIRSILHGFGIQNESQVDIFRAYLLGLPLRTIMQFMAVMQSTNVRSMDDKKILNVFLNDLLEQGVDTDLISSNINFLNSIILDFLLRSNSLDAHYLLQPTSRIRSIDSSLLALSFFSTRHIERTPFLIFDYLVKIGYVRNLASVIPQPRTDDLHSQSVRRMCEYSGVFRDNNLRDIAGLLHAYVRAGLNTERSGSWGGSIMLYALEKSAKRGNRDFSYRIDTVFRDELKRSIAYIPLSIIQPNSRQSSIPIYSIYSLLATIGEYSKGSRNRVELFEFSQVRTYPMPELGTSLIDNTSSYNFDDEFQSDFDEGRGDGEFQDLMYLWSKLDRELIVPPYLLGRISTRLFYAVSNIESSEGFLNLGEMFSIRIAAFFNAIIIECSKESNMNRGRRFVRVNHNNVQTSYRVLEENLHLIRKDEFRGDGWLFCRWMLSCPLFLVFLDPDIRDLVLSTFQIERYQSVKVFSVFEDLKRVSVRDDAPKSSSSDQKYFNSLVDHLRKSGIPFQFFDEDNPESTIKKNAYIRQNLLDFFDGDVTSNELRSFRKYLKSNGIQW